MTTMTLTEQTTMYRRADKAIQSINRHNVRAFQRLSLLPFDELNIMRETRTVYTVSARLAKKKYLDIGLWAFFEAMLLCGWLEEDARKAAEKAITRTWLKSFLNEYNPVTLYQFDPETERKMHRTAEALIASEVDDREVKKALRFWTLQLGQYAIDTVDRATVDAFKEAGVQYVQWIDMEDNRVCNECEKRHLKIYPIDKVPPKPHWGCRCELKPILK